MSAEYDANGEKVVKDSVRFEGEEAAYLFNEGRDADDVADIIQNRASVYISEKK
ncbi:MAG: hypothetical protein NC543_09665 [bacterium]|nr:hypothetical protein [bacterium]